MWPETFTAGFLGACLAVFYITNVCNLVKNRRRRKTLPTSAEPQPSEPEPPKTFLTALAMFGTLLFWAESIFYPILVFSGTMSSLENFLFPLKFPFDSYVQTLGIALTAFGYFFFTWSVVARGPYATAWGMPENHKIVTWGPYRCVRHPSYLSYFTLFLGLFLFGLHG
jgi:protein-S-isoprenylcysteine O-methyltransferase Ste14